jgi:hypothetical protein
MTRRRRVLIPITALLLSVFVTLVFIEGSLRLFWPQVFDPHPAGLYVSDSEAGYALRPGFEGWFSRPEFRTHIRVGNTGLRGADPKPRKPNSRRILCIGDSFTWGWGTDDDQAYPALLEQMLRRRYADHDVQVLNGGVPGYGNDEELAFLESRGPALAPDLVIVQFFPGNDFLDNRHPARERYEIRDGMLALRPSSQGNASRPGWPSLVEGLKRRSHLFHLVSERLGYLAMRRGMLDLSERYSAEEAVQTRDLLVELALRSGELGARSLLVFAPTKTHVLSGDEGTPRALEVVVQAAQVARVPYVDLSRHFRDHPERLGLFFAQDGHWIPRAHEMVAAVLAAQIAELDLIGANEGPDQRGVGDVPEPQGLEEQGPPDTADGADQPDGRESERDDLLAGARRRPHQQAEAEHGEPWPRSPRLRSRRSSRRRRAARGPPRRRPGAALRHGHWR